MRVNVFLKRLPTWAADRCAAPRREAAGTAATAAFVAHGGAAGRTCGSPGHRHRGDRSHRARVICLEYYTMIRQFQNHLRALPYILRMKDKKPHALE